MTDSIAICQCPRDRARRREQLLTKRGHRRSPSFGLFPCPFFSRVVWGATSFTRVIEGASITGDGRREERVFWLVGFEST